VDKVRFIDWFSGIGGFRLGLERAGHECAGACEIDEYARRVYLKHWPETEWFPNDITKVKSNEIPPPQSVLSGAFPAKISAMLAKARESLEQ
jgi:DNA (cytosine-5)-methyltransferase 1